MLQRFHWNLPAKFWRLVGCTKIDRWCISFPKMNYMLSQSRWFGRKMDVKKQCVYWMVFKNEMVLTNLHHQTTEEFSWPNFAWLGLQRLPNISEPFRKYSSKSLKNGRSWHNANEEKHFLTWRHSCVRSSDPIIGGHLDCWTFTERWLQCGMDPKLMEQSLPFEEILHSQLNVIFKWASY